MGKPGPGEDEFPHCYSLGGIHRPPLHVVILPLDVSQPLPEYLRSVIHIVIGGCPAGQKAQYDSVTSFKKKTRRKKHLRDSRLTEGEGGVLGGGVGRAMDKVIPMDHTRRTSEARGAASCHLRVVRTQSRARPAVESTRGSINKHKIMLNLHKCKNGFNLESKFAI